jgi:hypothetical protein
MPKVVVNTIGPVVAWELNCPDASPDEFTPGLVKFTDTEGVVHVFNRQNVVRIAYYPEKKPSATP